MSADLFAAFGNESEPQAQPSDQKPQAQAISSTPNFSFFDNPAGAASAAKQPQAHQSQWTTPLSTSDDNDDFGDFEDGSNKEPASSHQDAFSFTRPTQPAYISQTSWQASPAPKPRKTDPNVLFDAEEDIGDKDDDDFGDFEESESVPVPGSRPGGSTGLEDILGDLTVSQSDHPGAIKKHGLVKDAKLISSSPSKSPIGAFGSVGGPNVSSVPSPAITKKEDDTWDTFDDWEATIPEKKPTASAKRPQNPSGGVAVPSQPSISTPASHEADPGELPPTNVPPPAMLLTLFPPAFAEAQEKLFKPMAAQTLPMRNKLVAEPATLAYLQGYLMVASVAARIIAGRKLRWKRDQHLSQGMRIGPASSRATSGMKLTGIDKSENLKEEREVADVVRAWKEQIGRLRHVVSAANQIKTGTLERGPDLQETMPVKTLKQSEGGVPAPQPCMLCGLKREERVGTVDNNISDSFGEWWIEQVSMHRGCRNFWNEHKETLRHQ
ncbi:hypothetical protein EJ04DRAFT_27715 [Polyplosphaeria fusca]|uniref:Uncharacterized protein n=1 Tax=Polyplosphaeria fusca TaxID=682080 RepID=A0A9P4R849_9PLEO|nr:hypothetical protein EJ04DRAFT_27715 [Polyplosphaeria fusca]